MRKNEVPAWFMVNVKVAMVKTYRIEKDAWKKIVLGKKLDLPKNGAERDNFEKKRKCRSNGQNECNTLWRVVGCII